MILSILYIGDGYIYISFFFFFRECKCVELFRYVVRFLTCIDSNKLINMHKPDSQCEECITKIKSVHHYRSIYYRESYKCYTNWMICYKNKHNTEISAVSIIIVAFLDTTLYITNIAIRHNINIVVIYSINKLNY